MPRQSRVFDFGQRPLDRAQVILRQITRVSARVSDGLVLLVKLLRDLQRSLGTEAAPVGIALEAGQIVKQGRSLRRRLAFLRGDPHLLPTSRLDFFRLFCRPNAFRTGIFVAILGKLFAEPSTAVRSSDDIEIPKHFEERPRFKGVNPLFTLSENRQRWRLHPTNWRKLKSAGLVIECCHRARAVNSNQPIAFRTADCRLRKRN